MEILIVEGGYVGMYTARRLERLLRRSEATVTVVEPRGYMTYQPLLAEAASGSVEPRATGPTTSSTQAKAIKKPRALRHLAWHFAIERTSGKSLELRGFEPLTFCMPCSRGSSDGVALGPVVAVQSNSKVWGRLGRSGEI